MIPRDPSFPRDSLPTYITEVVSLGSFIADNHCFPPSEEIRLKILDFGRGKIASSACSEYNYLGRRLPLDALSGLTNGLYPISLLDR